MADRQHASTTPAAATGTQRHPHPHPHPTHDDTNTPVNHTHTAAAIPPATVSAHAHAHAHAPDTAAPATSAAAPVPSIRFIPYITDTHRGLNFPIIERKLPNGKVLHVKRFVEKGNVDLSDAIAFKSKVVSRQHGELWTDGMSFFYRDTKSSSGTFINNVRASPANTESQPIQLKDGDIIQLGVDYQGRTEDIFRCVRMRVELNREAFKHRNNAFRNQVIRALRALAAASDKDSTGTGDCCICLGAIAPFQALFIAPCCHSFHFKCARPLLQGWPNFNCPLCRHFADLSVSVSIEDLSMLVIDDGSGSPVGGDAHDHHANASPTSPPTARHDDAQAHAAAPAGDAVTAPAPTSSRTSNLLDPSALGPAGANGAGVHFALNAPTIERSQSGNATPPLPSTASGLLGVFTSSGSPALPLSGTTAPSSADAGALTPVAPATAPSTHSSPGTSGARSIPGAFPPTPAHGNTPTLGVPLAPPLGSNTSVATTQHESETGSRESNNVSEAAVGAGAVEPSTVATESAAADADAAVARVTQRMVGTESTSTRSSDEAIAQATSDEAAAAAARATSATPTAVKPQGPQQGGGDADAPASAGSSSGSPVLGASGGGLGQDAEARAGNPGSGVATPVAAGEAAAR